MKIDDANMRGPRVLRGNQITLAGETPLSLRREPPVEADRVRISDEPPFSEAADERWELRAQLDAALNKLEESAREAVRREREARQRGLATGREEGKAAAQRDTDAQKRLLETTTAQAIAHFETTLGRLETAAAAIALAAIEQVIGSDKAASKNVLLSLNRQLGQLREAAVVEIRVSTTDFKDVAPLSEVVKRNGHAALVKQDDALSSGQCRILLGLGEMALDLPDQLAALRQLLSGTE